MKHWKLIALVVALLFIAIVVVQNTDEVATKLLFVEVRMPRAVLLFATFAVGFALGVAIAMRAKRARQQTAAS